MRTMDGWEGNIDLSVFRITGGLPKGEECPAEGHDAHEWGRPHEWGAQVYVHCENCDRMVTVARR